MGQMAEKVNLKGLYNSLVRFYKSLERLMFQKTEELPSQLSKYF